MGNKTGVLLINLGTPESTGYWPMRRYLKEFLSDKRVIEARGPVWWLIFNGIILTRKPRTSGRAYAKIWNKELDESPLKTITRRQAKKIAEHFAGFPTVEIDWAMRYGKPAIAQATGRLMAQGCDRVLIFPLYPQYSAATTASAMDKVFEALKAMRWQPAIRSVPPYYDHPAYIKSLVQSIIQHRDERDWKPDVTLVSFHGLPEDFITQGDPYQSQCEETAGHLKAGLGLDDTRLLLTYQSRSGRAVWIGPDTEETLIGLARNGVKNVLVVTPGFSADCVETLEEIQIRAAQVFKANGGLNFSLVPCLNDSKDSVSMLADIMLEQLGGWLENPRNS